MLFSLNYQDHSTLLLGGWRLGQFSVHAKRRNLHMFVKVCREEKGRFFIGAHKLREKSQPKLLRCSFMTFSSISLRFYIGNHTNIAFSRIY
jgi:hypothetical protein